jgi:hypothetical protein
MGYFSGPGGLVFKADFFSREAIFLAFLTGFAGRGAPGILGASVAFFAASLASRRPFLPLPFPIVKSGWKWKGGAQS